ncbi:hypothetical protein ElyMa_002268000 [Elysia marginata]|uniref:Uncharacterized protein n=1 Tax=Elysia marginata TaxID=1093978 RepID=A0AAV4G106_9GAST|nr:hypothetical protein ElyMa_002268000 [Elysia marginata]
MIRLPSNGWRDLYAPRIYDQQIGGWVSSNNNLYRVRHKYPSYPLQAVRVDPKLFLLRLSSNGCLSNVTARRLGFLFTGRKRSSNDASVVIANIAIGSSM